jgi:hypothetical protein
LNPRGPLGQSGRFLAVEVDLLEDTDGDDFGASQFQDNPGEWSRRRALQDGAVPDGEDSSVTVAGEDTFFGVIKNGTGIVGAEAAVGEVRVRSWADQVARVIDAGILKNFGAADGNFFRVGDDARKIWARTIPETQQPQACGDRGEDGGHDEI